MVPRGANLENVKLINGGLSISGVAGPVKASSVNGSIKAEKLEGQAELSTVNGQLEAGFQRVSKCNPISLSSVNGPIQLSLPVGRGAQRERAQPERRHRCRFRTRPGGLPAGTGWRPR